MGIKPVLIVFVILNIFVEVYYGFSYFTYIAEFQQGNLPGSFFSVLTYRFVYDSIFMILGIAGVILYFVYNFKMGKILSIYLLHQVMEFIAFFPNKTRNISRILSNEIDLDIWRELIYLFNFIFIVLIIFYFIKRKISVLPRRVTKRRIRFSHYFIDNFYLNLLLLKVFGFQLAVSLNDFSMGNYNFFTPAFYIGLFMSAFLYYTVSESIFSQSIGKMITGAYVRSENGQSPNFGQILLRSICRYIPFEAFSFLPSPMVKWHDKFSNTDLFYQSNIQPEEDSIIKHLVLEEDRTNS